MRTRVVPVAACACAIALAAQADPAPKTPIDVTHQRWTERGIADLVAQDGYVVLVFTSTDLDCEPCRRLWAAVVTVSEVAFAARWHFTVVRTDDNDDFDADAILPGSDLPLVVMYRDRRLLAARSGFYSGDELEAWMAKTAVRTRRMKGEPLACARRLADMLVAHDPVGVADLVRYVELRNERRWPRPSDPLAAIAGVLASFTPVRFPSEPLELGDLVLDARRPEPRLLIVDRPTAPGMTHARGIFAGEVARDRPDEVDLRPAVAPRKILPSPRVLRPTGGTFCNDL